MVSATIKVVLAAVATLTTQLAVCANETEPRTPVATERKSYVSDEFGFAFEYPASWSLVEKRGAESGEARLSLKLLSPSENVPVRRDYSPGSVSVEVFANPQQRPLREWLDQNGWPFGADRSVTRTSIGGQPALEVATGKMFAPNRFTYVANKTWVLRVSAIEPESQAVVQSIRFNP